MGKTFPAKVRFLSAEEGGRLEPARDGIRPHLQLGDVMTTSVVHSASGATVFDSGKTYDVEIEIVFWDHYSHLFNADMPVCLFDGSKLIAVGEFIH